MTNTIPGCYLAAGRLSYQKPSYQNGNALWSVSWGGASYTGPNTGTLDNDADGNFAPPFAGFMPADSTVMLRFSGTATAMSTNNAADYAPDIGTFTNSAGESTSLRGGTPILRPSALGNISTRLRVETGDNALIGGFIVTGTQTKKVIVRAIGPSLPVVGALADPILELRDSSGALLASNDNWRSNQETEIVATCIPPSNDLESAIVAMLPANNAAYTAIVRGVNNGTGIGLVEAYDLDRTVDSKLANISTRGLVQTGDNVLIGGLIGLGQIPFQLRVIVRAIGPSLPVPGALGDPTLELRDGDGALLAANDNWRSDQEAEIIATGIPPSNDLESAIVQMLPADGAAYTAIVRGSGASTGVALVEVYDLGGNPTPTPSPTPSPASTPTATPTPTPTPSNVPPTATNLSAPETYLEDNALNLTDIVVSDIDSAAVTATLTLSNVAAGSLSTATSGAVTSTYDAGTGVWTASGAIADVNTLLAGVTFIPSANFNANFTIATSVTDGVAAALTGSKATTGTAVNDQPDMAVIDPLPPIPINSGLQTIPFGAVRAGPANEFGQTLTVTATSDNPGLIPNPTVNYTSPDTTGSLSYTPVAGQSGTAHITVTLMDDGGVLNGGVDTLTRMFPVFVSPAPPPTPTPTPTPANVPPTATNLSAPETYLEDNALNLTDIVVSDIDSAAVTATLTLSNVAAGSLSTATSGAVTSTYDAGTGVWTASGAIADVNALLAGVTLVCRVTVTSSGMQTLRKGLDELVHCENCGRILVLA